VKFTFELIDELLATYCIDPSRIYAAGKSNGGGFTGLLACDSKATERIAAFAPVSGAFYLDKATNKLPPCNPTTKRDVIPIMEFHGLKDHTIYYNGGPNDRHNAYTVSIPLWADEWATRNGFDVDAKNTTLLCQESNVTTRYSWNDTVVHYAVSNLYHDWPSTFANGDTNLTTCAEADATAVILEWFKKWKL
jgi:poly(3-hydroxybutyrate) depolymerase